VYAGRLGYPKLLPLTPGCRHFLDSGYVRLQNERAVLLIDVARIGPDYLPGHAHADTLSFELSVDGQRVIVNSGTSVYGVGPERQRQRGTVAHNTVIVAHRNSSEVWSGFRVGRRARPFDLKVEAIKVSCSHDGYRRLAGGPVHRRMVTLRLDGLDVEDSVTGGEHDADARFHFHPHWMLSRATLTDNGLAKSSKGSSIEWRIGTGQGRLEPSSFHPEFGIDIPSTCLAVRLAKGQSCAMFRW
jgi:uncharacterized heparinase superfamily protein